MSRKCLWAVALSVCAVLPASAQGPAGRGGRGGPVLPGATPDQMQAVAAMNAALTDQTAAVTAARNALTIATFAVPKNSAAITSAVSKLRDAELALATARAEAFAKVQSGPNRLNDEQVGALAAQAAGGGRGGPPPGGALGRGRG
jgi:hypothetical protein